jgi:isoquinoline 1-oxidoreductase beta subunit
LNEVYQNSNSAPYQNTSSGNNGSVTVLSNTSEIGQGTGTAIAQILADELDVEWKRIRLEMAPVEKDYFNATWGEYATYGSGGIAGQYEALRTAGAQARARLIAAAAARWKVPAAECDTSLGTVVHAKSGRKVGYAALVADAAATPEIANVPPMPPERWRYVGREMKRLDIPAKVDGSARLGLDANPKGALVATVRQAPRFGGRLASVDPAPAMKIEGVRGVVKLDDAVAVVAKDYWTAKRGLDALDPKWDDSKASTATSPAYEGSLVAAVKAGGTIRVRRNTTVEAMTAEHGAAMAKGVATVESIYTAPFLHHATMGR